MPSIHCLNRPDRDDFLAECVLAAAARSRMFGTTMDAVFVLPGDDANYPDNVKCWGPSPAQINQVRALYGALADLMFEYEESCDSCDGWEPVGPIEWTGSRDNSTAVGGVVGMGYLDVTDGATWRAGTGGAGGSLGACDIVVAEHVDELATARGLFSWWVVLDPENQCTDDDCATCFSGEYTDPVSCMADDAWPHIVRMVTGWGEDGTTQCTLAGSMNATAWWGLMNDHDVGWYMSYWCCEAEDEFGVFHYVVGYDPGNSGSPLIKLRIDACTIVKNDPPYGGEPLDGIMVCDAAGTEYPSNQSEEGGCWKVTWSAGSEPAALSAISTLCTACQGDCSDIAREPGTPCAPEYSCESFTYDHLEQICCTIYGHVQEPS